MQEQICDEEDILEINTFGSPPLTVQNYSTRIFPPENTKSLGHQNRDLQSTNRSDNKPNANQMQKKSKSDSIFQFRIIPNEANGNCLFYALSEFLQKSTATRPPSSSSTTTGTTTTPETVPTYPYYYPTGDKFEDATNLRKICVKFITSPDKNDIHTFTRWRNFRTDVKINLENHIDFFKSYNPNSNSKTEVNDTDWVEVEARQRYANYMSVPGNYGTATEISAAMAIYKFCVTLIKQNSRDSNFYEIFHLGGENMLKSPNSDSTLIGIGTENGKKYSPQTQICRRAYMLFTGNPTKGHFELLDPLSDCSSLLLPSKRFKVDKEAKLNGRIRYISLVLCGSTDVPRNYNIFSNMMDYCKSILTQSKRKFKETDLSENGDDDSKSDYQNFEAKRRKLIDNDDEPSIAIRKASLNSHECVLLIKYYAEQVSQLRDEFMLSSSFQSSPSKLKIRNNNRFKFYITEGVTKSRILSNGNLNTIFVQFQPKAKTEFCISNYDVSFLFYQGASITLRTISGGDCEGPEEVEEDEPRIESEPFQLPKGSRYALENHHKQTLLLRVFWYT